MMQCMHPVFLGWPGIRPSKMYIRPSKMYIRPSKIVETHKYYIKPVNKTF